MVLFYILWSVVLSVFSISITEIDYSSDSAFKIIFSGLSLLFMTLLQIYDFYLIYSTNKEINEVLDEDLSEYTKENLSSIYKSNIVLFIMKFLGYFFGLFEYAYIGGTIALLIYIGLKVYIFIKYRNIQKMSHLES